MSAQQNAVLLNEGRELDVGLVAGADEFLLQLLGGASAKAGPVTLKPVKNSAGVPFVAVIIGGKHAGFLPQDGAAEVFSILADCEQRGMVPQAKARVAAPVGGQARPLLQVSLAEPDRLMPASEVESVAAASPAVAAPTPPSAAFAAGVPSAAETSPPVLAGRAAELPPQSSPAGAYQETWRVEGDRIISPSPLMLPEGCVTCGEPIVNGRRFDKTLFYCPPWVWLTILVGLLPFIIIYLVVRKPLAISYAQCNTCVGRQNAKKWIAAAVWVLFLAAVAVSIWSQSLIALIVMVVLFAGALVATTLASPPVRVTGHEGGYFLIKGGSPRFLSNLAGTGDLTAAAPQAPAA